MTKTVASIIAERGIREVVHFTTNRGFVGCLAKGEVLPRNRLREDDYLEHILTLNSPFRTEESPSFDRSRNWIDYVNLSISEISTNLFRCSTLKWHAGKDFFWVIMGFEPEVMAHDDVHFSTTNNIYPEVRRSSGPVGLEALFASVVPRKPAWLAHRRTRAEHLPTCEQAEVLYPKGLPMEFLRTVYVREGDQADSIYAMLSNYCRKDVVVKVDPSKFEGAPN